MTDNDRHVVPHPDGGWDVKAPHAVRASSHHDTQAAAIDRAREVIANAGGGELVTHGTDGRIRESDTVTGTTHHSGEPTPATAVAPSASAAVDPQDVVDLTGTRAVLAAPLDASTQDRDPKKTPTLGAKVRKLFHLAPS